MIGIILSLILISFIQAALLPVNLVLIILLVHSFICGGKEDLILGFSFGLLLSLLLGYPLGSLSFIYLILVVLVHLLQKTRFASYWIIIWPLVSILLLVSHLFEILFFSTYLNLVVFIPEVILIMPIYFIFRFLDERFIPQKEIRLKIGK